MNTMEFFPLFLRLHDQPVLVIGGGRVAERKVRHLVAAGARVTVIAPTVSAAITAIAHSCHVRPATPDDIQPDFRLVILATDSSALHDQLSKRCSQMNILYNRGDDALQSEFVIGSPIDSSPFVGAVIASGSPGVGRLARARMEAVL
ncbi:MAG TPA: bifunctional precorrin-2 dehydrogenase/sirohydrochlorin ferrochelatase, partial [Candidatus Ozemobacteraceae bacterium]|nr:bifunctional precorrin-2 dehydrogenase/sirohydrochlorin ferrochelatase [Candidatus Ozemobacteraceae bacterium]